MPKKLRFAHAGFTLVELLVAISIIGIVAGITISSTAALQRSSRDATRKTDMSTVQSALQQYYADQGFYPDSLTFDGNPLTNCTGHYVALPATCTISKIYLNKTPMDPNSSTQYCYASQKGSPLIDPVNNVVSCSNASTGTCHYYSLCTKLENPGSSSTTCDCVKAGVTYNYQVRPQ